MKFSITALLLLTFVVSVVVAIFSNQQQHPKQVLHVLRNLKHVSPYAGTKDVCELLVVPFRPADYKHLEKPIYYVEIDFDYRLACLLYTSPSPRDRQKSRMPSSA